MPHCKASRAALAHGFIGPIARWAQNGKPLPLQCGERNDVSDGRAVREQHGQAVHPEPHPRSGGHAILQGGQEVLVQLHLVLPFLRPLRLGPRLVAADLGLEAGALVDGVRQLGEGVGELPAGHEELEALRHPGLVPVRLGQRADRDGVLQHEGGLDEPGLHGRLEHLVEQMPWRLGRPHLGHVAGLGSARREHLGGPGLGAVELLLRHKEVLARLL
mmetsp:Transcript_29697/g.82981  ORF Transcript_29697/g.82981 Transcript_29697/m.82981 type:complete len:217 (-) Transcript_29697:787-1437(-)